MVYTVICSLMTPMCSDCVHNTTSAHCCLVCQLVWTMLHPGCIQIGYSLHQQDGATMFRISYVNPISVRNLQGYSDLFGRIRVLRTMASCSAALGSHMYVGTCHQLLTNRSSCHLCLVGWIMTISDIPKLRRNISHYSHQSVRLRRIV